MREKIPHDYITISCQTVHEIRDELESTDAIAELKVAPDTVKKKRKEKKQYSSVVGWKLKNFSSAQGKKMKTNKIRVMKL